MRIMDSKFVLSVLFYGSIWGAMEAVVGGFLHRTLPFFPYNGVIMIALAAPLLASLPREKGIIIATGCVAASFKTLNFIFFTSPSIFRPMMAIMVEALMLETILLVSERYRGVAIGTAGSLGTFAAYLMPPRIAINPTYALSFIIMSLILCPMMLVIVKLNKKPSAGEATGTVTFCIALSLLAMVLFR